jgi:hypothetical protein
MTSRNKPRLVAAKALPADAGDLGALFDDQLDDEGLTSPEELFNVALGKPKKFVQIHPHKDYQRKVHVFCLKGGEDEYGEEVYYILPEMVQHFGEDARPCILSVWIDRTNNFGIWPLKIAKLNLGEKDYPAWKSARQAARALIGRWGKVIWTGRGYKVRPALPGYGGEPDFSKIPPMDQVVLLAFGEERIIRSTKHPVFCDNVAGTPIEEEALLDDGEEEIDAGPDDGNGVG